MLFPIPTNIISTEGLLLYTLLYFGIPASLICVFGTLSIVTHKRPITRWILYDFVKFWFCNMFFAMFVAFLLYKIVLTTIPLNHVRLLEDFSTPIQFLILYFFVELGFYVLHVALHKIPFLWRFHKLHHEPYQLSYANSFKDSIVTTTGLLFFFLVAAEVLGISMFARFLVFFVYELLAALSHFGTPWRFGRLDYFFLSPGVHYYHHQLVFEGKPVKNFGGAISLFDHLFNTADWGEAAKK